MKIHTVAKSPSSSKTRHTNKGEILCFVPEAKVAAALDILREDPLCSGAVRIGAVTDAHPGKVVLKTGLGGRRLFGRLEGEQLPRIC